MKLPLPLQEAICGFFEDFISASERDISKYRECLRSEYATYQQEFDVSPEGQRRWIEFENDVRWLKATLQIAAEIGLKDLLRLQRKLLERYEREETSYRCSDNSNYKDWIDQGMQKIKGFIRDLHLLVVSAKGTSEYSESEHRKIQVWIGEHEIHLRNQREWEEREAVRRNPTLHKCRERLAELKTELERFELLKSAPPNDVETLLIVEMWKVKTGRAKTLIDEPEEVLTLAYMTTCERFKTVEPIPSQLALTEIATGDEWRDLLGRKEALMLILNATARKASREKGESKDFWVAVARNIATKLGGASCGSLWVMLRMSLFSVVLP